MAKKEDQNLFQKLTKLFRSGPVVKRKIRALDTTIAVADKTKSSGALLFQKSMAPTYATITANAYNLSERLMRYQDFCFTGDTLVATTNKEGCIRIDEIVERWNAGEKDVWIFSYDEKIKSIVSARITNAKCNGRRSIVSVSLDDGSVIKCTPDHRFMLKDGSYVEAQNLKSGTALMRFSRSDFNTPYRYIQTHSRGWKPEHVLVAEAFAGRLCEKGEHVHHRNFKHRDNHPTNLEIMSEHDHMSLHAKINNLRFEDPKQRENLSRIMKSRREETGDLRVNLLSSIEKAREGNRERRVAFNKSFKPGRFNKGRKDQVGILNGNADKSFTYQDICNSFCKGDILRSLSLKLGISEFKIKKRLLWEGFKGFSDFSSSYENHKVISVVDNNEEELVYDIEVKGYSNFALAKKDDKLGAQGIVIVHNCEMEYTPELAAALDIYADETCLSGDSIVPLLDGTRPTIKSLYESNREDFWLYSFDTCKNEIVPGQATKVVKTGTKNLFRLNFDDGAFLRLTDNHRVLLGDGEYVHARDLKVGESVRSLYTSNSLKEAGDKTEGHEKVSGWKYTHKIVSIEEDGVEDVFDLEVKRWHNFATTSSPNTDSFVFVHNCAQDDKGRVLHVYSDNEKIREILEDLFYNTLNVEFNLRSWVRNLVKYGDMFLYNDVSPEHGVISAFPIPVNELEREENYDPNDPMAVRYRWVTLGNRTLENWEVTHFRLLGNDMFLPYGSSIIEPARRIWRQLILIEDAMLVYRVVRAPERRVFYIDVANIPPENVPMYVEEQRKNLRSSQVIDRNTGRVDLRYNPLSVDEDYFIPVRGGDSGTRIDTLAGGQNTAAVEDVAYIQKKLFAALKIPRAYLGYDESLSSKATLAQEDIRFSRTINVIQKTIVAELNKLAIIHLYAHGFDSEDLQNFALRMSNPSTIAQQQKLELWRAKFEIAGSAPEGQMSKEFIRKEIWGLNDDQCKDLDEQRLKEKLVDQAIESAEHTAGGDEEETVEEPSASEEESGSEEETSGEEGAADLFAGDDASQRNPYLDLLTAGDDPDDEEVTIKFSLKDVEVPVKAQKQLDRALYNRSKIRHHGPSKTHSPDFNRMMKATDKNYSDPYDKEWMNSYVRNPFGESSSRTVFKTLVGNDVISSLRNMSLSPKFQKNTKNTVQPPQVLSESDNFDEADAREHREVLIIDDDGSK